MMTYALSRDDSVRPDAIDAAIACLRSGQHTMGRTVDAFERMFATYVGSPHAVMVNSGSSANLLAIEALMRPSHGVPLLRAGDEVLVPALAWPTTVWPLVQLGLVPVFVDVDPFTLAMDLDDAATMCSTRTRGAMLIHVLGRAADVAPWQWFCQDRHMTLIEDACESVGTRVDDRHVGTTGMLGTFSHYFSHQLSTIEGGMVVTADAAMADDLRSMRSHGWTRSRSDRRTWEEDTAIDPRFLFVSTGYNVRPMELQAAMGLVQLTHLPNALAERMIAARCLRSALAPHPWLQMSGSASPEAAWMHVPIVVRDGAPMCRDDVVSRLNGVGIDTRPILAGNLLRHPVMHNLRRASGSPYGGPQAVPWARRYPVADRLMDHGFLIGCHLQGIQHVIDAFDALGEVAA